MVCWRLLPVFINCHPDILNVLGICWRVIQGWFNAQKRERRDEVTRQPAGDERSASNVTFLSTSDERPPSDSTNYSVGNSATIRSVSLVSLFLSPKSLSGNNPPRCRRRREWGRPPRRTPRTSPRGEMSARLRSKLLLASFLLLIMLLNGPVAEVEG